MGSESKQDRRAFLQRTLAIAGLVTAADAMPAQARQRLSRSFIEESNASALGVGKNLQLAQWSPYDGLLTNFVQGTIQGLTSDSVTVSSPAASVPEVAISVTAQTMVAVRSTLTTGSLVGCQVGDVVDIGTTMTGGGSRVARWVFANPVIHRAYIGAISGTNLQAQLVDRRLTDLATSETVHLTPFTWKDPGTAPCLASSGEPMFPLSVGQFMTYSGCASSPDPTPSDVWLLTLAA